MKIYWTLNDFPEFSNMNPEELRRVRRELYGKAFRYWETWLGLLACGLCAGLGTFVGEAFGHSLIGAGIGGGIGGFVFSQIVVRIQRRHYRDVVSPGKTKPRHGENR